MPQQVPHKISKVTERKLIGYLDKVAEHINDGASPNEAIVKVARAYDVELGHVRLLAQAYNNARTNQQNKSSEALHEKIASFALADVKQIVNELYPKQIKSAAVIERDEGVSDEYKFSPNIKFNIPTRNIKLASAPPLPLPRDPVRHVKKAHSLLHELNRDFEERRRLMNASRDKVASAYSALLDYFRQQYKPVRYKEAAANATALWGRSGKILMDTVAKDMPHLLKEASCQIGPIDRSKEPFNIIARCLDAAAEHSERKAEFNDFSKKADVASQRLVEPFLPTPPKRIYGSIVKAAGDDDVFSQAITGVKNVVDPNVGLKPIQTAFSKGIGKPESKLKTEAYMDVTEPQHEARIRGLKAQAMLSDMMANDPFLSGEPPERVVGLYNQITKLSPRAADQPLLMRALLRRYLAQGQVDPHDIDQLAGIEVKLKQRDEPTREYNLPKINQDFTAQSSTPARPREE